jgi:sec-independent protein translocase protein TatA
MFPLIGMPEGAEWLVILAIVILVFGAAKLPDLARGTGQALRIFKAETKGLRDEDKKDGKPTLTAEQITAAPVEDSVALKQAELDRKQAELDAERARLQQPDA